MLFSMPPLPPYPSEPVLHTHAGPVIGLSAMGRRTFNISLFCCASRHSEYRTRRRMSEAHESKHCEDLLYSHDGGCRTQLMARRQNTNIVDVHAQDRGAIPKHLARLSQTPQSPDNRAKKRFGRASGDCACHAPPSPRGSRTSPLPSPVNGDDPGHCGQCSSSPSHPQTFRYTTI